jgi:CubicO group peptidase (beta-lactamase class C family)
MVRLNRLPTAAWAFMLLLSIACPAAHADRIDDYIAAQMRWENIPGLSLAVVKDGKIVKARGYGLANVETNTPATPETVYKIGSVSKQFLAAGVMLLVEQGKLNLDDRVGKYLDGTPETWNDITIRRLLTHTSGIVREAPDFDPLKMQPDLEVIKSSYKLPLRFAPGVRWAYSNVNYYCLAEIIHRVTGKPWSQFITENIFTPAGMSATRTTSNTDIVPHRASGYTSTQSGLTNAEIWLALRPSGAFLSSVLDFAKWDAALDSRSILSSLSYSQMWSPVLLNDGTTYGYGFGWFLGSFQGHKRIYHSGGVPGFVCEFDRFVDDRVTVILMANISNRDLSDIAAGVAGFYVPALKPAGEKPLAEGEPQVTERVRAIVTGLTNQTLDPGAFTPDMASQLTAEVKSGAFRMLRTFGPVVSFPLIGHAQEGDNRIYHYRLAYRDMTLFIDCTLDKNGKMARFGLHD